MFGQVFTFPFVFVVAQAVFDPRRSPYLTDNRNPADADPGGRITCPDVKPDWNLTLDGERRTTDDLTLLQICAKPQYGGLDSNRGKTTSGGVGAWCKKSMVGGFPAQELQAGESSKVETTGFSPLSYNMRMVLYCYTRCFCSTDLNGNEVLAKPKAPEPGLVLRGVDYWEMTQIFALDTDPKSSTLKGEDRLRSDLRTSLNSDISLMYLRTGAIGAVVLPLSSQVRNARKRYNSLMGLPQDPRVPALDPIYRALQLRLENKPQCSGGKPDMRLPAPFSMDDFDSAQDFCANVWAGGNPAANVGAYCHRLRPSDPWHMFHSDLWFLDEVTPRLEWTWSQNFRFSLIARAWCASVCKCLGRRNIEASSRRASPFFLRMADLALVKLEGKATSLQGIAPARTDSAVRITNSDGHPSQCNGQPTTDEVCQYDPWPTDLLGKKPGLYPEFFEPQSLPTCGGSSCQGPAFRECGDFRSDEDGCKCVLPNSKQATLLGLDPVAPVTICLSVALFKKQVLRPMKEPRGLDDAGFLDNWDCPCNGTYASSSCCDSLDGFV